MDKEVKKHMVGGYEFNTKEDAQLVKMNLMLLNMCRQRLIRKILSRYIIFIIK